MEFTSSAGPEKVNWGVLPEVSEICINRFDMSYVNWETMKAFFMTHYDQELVWQVLNADFLEALLEPRGNFVRLYMHKEALSYLEYFLTTQQFPDEDREHVTSLLEKVKETGKLAFLEVNLPVLLLFGEKCIQVTAMSSGHDVGCVMLLIEVLRDEDHSAYKRILYSGKFRLIEKDMCRLRPLYHDQHMRMPKRLTAAYLDTTFCTEEVEELPARGKVIFELIEETMKMMNEDPKIRIDFKVPMKGGLSRVFQYLADETCQKIHVPHTLATYWARLDAEIGMRVTSLTDEERERHSNYHYDCGEEYNHEESCIWKKEDWGFTQDGSTIVLGCQPGPKPEHSKWSLQIKNTGVYWPVGSPVILPWSFNQKRCLYSGSMSRFELGRFINKLNIHPTTVQPLYKPKSMTIQEMRALILDTCRTVGDEPVHLRREISGSWFDLTNTPQIQARNASLLLCPSHLYTF